MISDYSREDIEFAEQVRAYVRSTLDPLTRQKEIHGKLASRCDRTRWQRALVARGWGAPAWPVEFGGTGWSPIQRHLFDEVLAEEGAPAPPVFGIGMLAPVLMKFGTEQQKEYYLPRILTLDDWWCQGFSEPGAGSDLASLQTRVVSDGEDFIVNGQKIWTTLAHWADWMFCLVRTSQESRKQLGITMLLIDMRSPGISVRPIITIDGEHEVNEVFFANVRVPACQVVGEVGKGWSYAKYLLSHERTGIARAGHSRRQLRRLKRLAAREPSGAGTVSQTWDFRRKIADIDIRLKAIELMTLHMLERMKGGVAPGTEANILKVKGSEIQQELSEMLMDLAGSYAFAYDPHAWEDGTNPDALGPAYASSVAGNYFNTRKVSIYGGSNEIQRNIIAKAALGL